MIEKKKHFNKYEPVNGGPMDIISHHFHWPIIT